MWRTFVLLVFVATLDVALAIAQPASFPPFELTRPVQGEPLYVLAEALEDPNGTLTIEDVASEPYSTRFKPITERNPVFGITASAWWVRFRVHNPYDEPVTWYTGSKEGMLDQFDLYVLHQGGKKSVTRLDEWDGLKGQTIRHRLLMAKAVTEGGATDTVYTRCRFPYAGPISLETPLWTEKEFQWFRSGENYLLGVFYGGLLVMFFYNLFLFFSVGDRIFLYYILYIAGCILSYAAINGVGRQWLWADYPIVSFFGPYTIPLSYIFLGLFSRRFLQTAYIAPRADKVILGLIGVFMAILAVSCANFGIALVSDKGYAYQTWMAGPIYLAILSAVILPFIGAYLWAKGFRPARLYVIGWSTFLAGSFYRASVDLGLMQGGDISRWAPQIGTWLEIIILSFALGDRINILNKEKEEAEARYLETLESAKEELEIRVTERTAALQAAKERAENATALKDKFVSLVSHDLRSPIGNVKMMASMQADKTMKSATDPEKQKMTFERIVVLSEGLLGLIDKLLDVSRLQSGSIELRKRFVEIRQLAGGKINALEAVAYSKGILLVNDLPKGVRLFIDPALYGEALANLLGNAVKFCRSGDTVTLYCPEDQRTVVAIKDTGPGVDPDILPDLFRSEIKTSLAGSAGERGSGLGLPYCREIMVAHGGDLTVESATGEGSTFFLLAPDVSAVILLVDDQQAQRELMKESLAELEGVEMVEAENGKEAMSIMQETRPHLVITDLSMPILDGYDLIRTMKKDPALSDIPILVATASESNTDDGDIDVRNRVFALGANDFVTKPVHPGEFIPRVRRFIQ